MSKFIGNLPPQLPNYSYSSILKIHFEKIEVEDNQCGVSGIRLKWWGETQPLFSKLPSTFEYYISEENIKYYLKCCDVVEFSLTNSHGDILGSSFFRNPIRILECRSYTLPVIDHRGDVIGEMIVTFSINHLRGILSEQPHVDDGNDKKISEIEIVNETEKNRIKSSQSNIRRYGIAASLAARGIALSKSPNKCKDSSEERRTARKRPEESGVQVGGSYLAYRKLVEYLLGKELSPHEEHMALTFLKETTPPKELVYAFTNSYEGDIKL